MHVCEREREREEGEKWEEREWMSHQVTNDVVL